jgi:hypothetical protein
VPGHDREAARVAADGFVLLEGELDVLLAVALPSFADDFEQAGRIGEAAQTLREPLVDLAKSRFR